MEHFKLVLPKYLNPGGSLFGGYLLKWIDEVAFMTACLEFPSHNFVTIALDDVLFKHRITSGEILRFVVKRQRIGTCSVGYNVQVFGTKDNRSANDSLVMFETNITFVSTNGSGEKTPISKVS